MLESFLNPFTMAAGGLLISSPIIIHLINRMRFKRVRWAAMEFLLKSQQRNRRRLIIEQLILLLLRILAVLMVAFLLARFLGFNPNADEGARPTLHTVIIDDTPSTGDAYRQDGETIDAFATTRKLVTESIATAAATASAPQEMVVLRLSDLATPRRFDRLGSGTIDEIRTYLGTLKPGAVRIDLQDGITKAKELFQERPELTHVLHIVSDFRTIDWSEGNPESLTTTFEQLKEARVETHLHDIAHPTRTEATKVPLYHDNLSLIDLRAESRLAARYAPVEFVAQVANYSNSERKNVRVVVRLNGSERAEASTNIPTVPPNQVSLARFALAFERTGSPDRPLDRFNLVSATIEGEDTGLEIDNTRYAVVEARDRVPMLMIEGVAPTGGPDTAESFRLNKLFTETVQGYDVIVRSPSELEKTGLRQYSNIFLINVRELSDKAVKNLTEYVQAGGGVGFFMGPNVRPEFYNKLYADGKGLFPVPLADAPTDPLKPEERASRLFTFQMQIFPREETHPALERLYTDGRGDKINREQYNKDLRFVVIDRYFPVPRLKWKPDLDRVQELMTLPNFRPMAEYERTTRSLLDRIPDDAKFSKYTAAVNRHVDMIKATAASTKQLYTLGNAIDEMLNDSGDPLDPANKPNLQEFWQLPELNDLRQEFEKLLATVRYGDPLYVASQFGNGRVTAFLTTATSEWNDLDGYGRAYFPPLMIEMQRYLAGAGTDINRAVGGTISQGLDPTVYSSKIKRTLLSEEADNRAGDRRGAGPARFTDLGEQVLESKNNELQLTFAEAKKPGVYLFELGTQRSGSPGSGDSGAEYQAYAFNVDASTEGNLRRIDREELLKIAPGSLLHTPDTDLSDVLSKRRRDWSESPWLYLALLLILVAEQAMAVRLSFHTAGGETPLPPGARFRAPVTK
ncbi:BatA domain-containing protein [Tuwongella immobilis]|uniref:Aerotolerance regulator N-terminal domain-containing protein n=1 Tax=Tuwongella immobilis TaxID=692036 RepID=A0A6C2YQG6_9BACT|nr:BatA domain-containing protein [Tuwongella immobilis]VIP03880.1 Hypothetical conserved protein OS=uncultured planctomycete GN=HGMM_F48A06C25 PE=4 SV=1: BatA [Tuwongella immobilis]VTS05127.1 Hypothetical conserved protein OS=uncultured planctomycete GN=HGMM_F48A06C25 PE=4 SV=1: BatA [Tuwongella immobilis]